MGRFFGGSPKRSRVRPTSRPWRRRAWCSRPFGPRARSAAEGARHRAGAAAAVADHRAGAPLRFITAFLLPYLEREQREGSLVPGVDLDAAAEFVARMVLSLIGSPGDWDLDDPAEVRVVVRTQAPRRGAHPSRPPGLALPERDRRRLRKRARTRAGNMSGRRLSLVQRSEIRRCGGAVRLRAWAPVHISIREAPGRDRRRAPIRLASNATGRRRRGAPGSGEQGLGC